MTIEELTRAINQFNDDLRAMNEKAGGAAMRSHAWDFAVSAGLVNNDLWGEPESCICGCCLPDEGPPICRD